MKRKVIAFIDGFNLYHAIQDNERKYKWLNLKKLAQAFISPNNEEITEVLYFTALAEWAPDKLKRHKSYIEFLEHFGVETVYGKFKVRDRYCKNCKTYYSAREEKQTDVNIAIHLLSKAFQGAYDKALIISGDSDLIPSIKAVKKFYPDKEVCVVIPVGRRAIELKAEADSHRKMKRKHLELNQLPDQLEPTPGHKIVKPSEYS